MLDQTTTTLVQEIVTGKVSKQEAFTAFDVTKEVRDILNQKAAWAGTPRPMVANDDVRAIVHEQMSDGIDNDPDYDGYASEAAVVDAGRGVSAIVYFHDSQPTYVSKYATVATTANLGNGILTNSTFANGTNNANLRAAPHVGGYQAPTPSAPTTATATKRSAPYSGTGPKSLDDKLRLRVPKNLLSAAGFNAGDAVEVYFHDGEKSIVVTSPAGATLTLYAVYGVGNWVNAKCLGTHTVDEYGNIRIGLKSQGVTTGLAFDLSQLSSSKWQAVIAVPATV